MHCIVYRLNKLKMCGLVLLLVITILDYSRHTQILFACWKIRVMSLCLTGLE